MSTKEEEERDDELNPRKVSWTVFVWVTGAQFTLISVLGLWTMNANAQAAQKAIAAEAKVDAFSQTLTPINVAIGQIQRDVDWIKQSLLSGPGGRR